MFNPRTYQHEQEIINDLEYELSQIEQEIDDEWELEDSDHYHINQLEHARRRYQQDIQELKMSIKETA